MFNSVIIKKGKAEKGNMAKKLKPSLLHGMEELEPEEKFETSEKAESYDLPETKKLKPSAVPSAEKVKPEAMLEIDLMLSKAKKKPEMEKEEEADSYKKDKGYYQSEKYKNKIKARSGK
jgi:hypothetical protein